MKAKKPQNRLAHETSPYLLQHAHNPVEWYPWGEEALKRARREDRPIFLSIGYSACHWCHVMERESFEDGETAKLMNEHFVNIKVDREERQDLDHIYMSAVQLMTQHGGWPMSVFLTPELEPFYGGTYFPPEDRHGLPSFKRILSGVAHAWKHRKSEVQQSARQLVGALQEVQGNARAQSVSPLSLSLVDHAVRQLAGAFDSAHGGFGGAPKFFHSMDMQLLLRQWRRTGDKSALGMVTLTLDKLARGGIYDQLGGGFHRYSTDPEWLAPHFEKMLYDNALLATLYLEAYQATGNPELARVAGETLDYVLREMTAPGGGFYATQDADTEHEEGKFYVWTREEVTKALGEDLAGQFCEVFDVTSEGNWEGRSILRRLESMEESAKRLGMDLKWLEDGLATAKRKLFQERSKRVTPFRDEKILVSWNGLMIHAMAMGYQVLHDERLLDAAKAAAAFIVEKMAVHAADGKPALLHVHKDGRSRFTAYLDDYAGLVHGLVTLYESDFDSRWLKEAIRFAEVMTTRFWDDASKCFYFTANDHEPLITRVKETHDGATPSGTSMAILGLLRLGRLTGRDDFVDHGQKALATLEPTLRLIPGASAQLLVALDFLLDQPKEIALVAGDGADGLDTLLHAVRERFIPNKVVAALRSESDRREMEGIVPLFKGRTAREGKATAYVCEAYTCKEPVTETAALLSLVEEKVLP